MNFKNLFGNAPKQLSPYDSLSQTQKLAAMNLMIAFGGSCSMTDEIIGKINHIMTVVGQEMNVSAKQVNSISFVDMKDMVDKLKGCNRMALEKLLGPFYCIVCMSNSLQAVQVLINIYAELGFSAQDCAIILEKMAGRKVIEF